MYLSITGVTPDNKLAKYQPFELEVDADSHATEFGGFVIPDPGGNQEFWIIDQAAKTITQDIVAETASKTKHSLAILRRERNKQLEESDKDVLPDRWHSMDAVTQEKWADYRQELRDLPANTDDPANPTWPETP